MAIHFKIHVCICIVFSLHISFSGSFKLTSKLVQNLPIRDVEIQFASAMEFFELACEKPSKFRNQETQLSRHAP